jgi:agmatine deiminase
MYRMPAEWAHHSATWIAWPHEESDWPDRFSPIKWVYSEIVRALQKSESVYILCHNSAVKAEVRSCLEQSHIPLANVFLVDAPNDRSWLRDSAGICVFDEHAKLYWLQWQFNAWAKYDNFALDARVPEILSAVSETPIIRALSDKGDAIVLEGGAIDVDGEGTLLATEECLISTTQERNPGFSKSDYEEYFLKYLGVSKVIWLEGGVDGDDTHGHIDDVARFVAPGVVVTVLDDDENARHYQTLKNNIDILSSSTDAKNRPLEVHILPMPAARMYQGEVLPASYANFYIANTCVLVPTFNDPQDSYALEVLANIFPNKEIIGINCCDLVIGQGTLHCLTQQQIAAQ